MVLSSPRFLALLLLLVLPALVPRAAGQQVFRDRNWRVRVCVEEDLDQLIVQGDGAYQVLSSRGAPLATLQAGQPYFIQITRGRPGGRTYRLVLNELEGHQDRQAIELGKTARDKLRLPVKVLRIAGKTEGSTRIVVTVGEYDALPEAREAARGLTQPVEFIYEDRQLALEGQIRLLGRQGSILAADPRSVRIVPLNIETQSIHVYPYKGTKWSQAELAKSRHYRGDLDLVINEEGTLAVVNDLWIEYYLYAVVKAEMGDFAPDEALKAQAVAGRSEAVAKIQMGITPSSFFDFYDTAMAQVYRGKGDETANVRAVVDSTRGEILIHDGQVIDAVYSANCGGIVASAADIWDSTNAGWSKTTYDRLRSPAAPPITNWNEAHEWTSSMPSALCNPNQEGFPKYARGNYHWTRSMSGTQLSNLADKLYGTGPVKDVIIDRRVPSGRVRKMRIVGERRTATITRELALRESLNNLQSTFFTFTKETGADGRLSRITIYGAGFGHGVGMCQMGAFMMAKKGYNYRQILGQYYHDVRIRQLYR